jgi:PBSX family phage terminase large subunit
MTVTAHAYTPAGRLLNVFSNREPELLVAGPAGTGKSRACLEKLHAMALLNPGMRGLIVRKTLASLGSTALVTWRRDVIPESQTTGACVFYGGSAEEPPQYRFSNGSVIVIGGMDKSSKIMSAEYDIVYVQEATELSEDDWELITTRLRSNMIGFQQLLGDCNPDTPTHWLKRRCDDHRTVLIESRHEDNPLLYVDGQVTPDGADYIAKLDALTGVRYQRLRRGLWVAAEGMIWDNYDPAVHLVDPFPIPIGWPRWWAIDFGYTNPFVAQCWTEDPDGRLYLYREIYKTGRTVDEHANRLKTVVAPNGKWVEPKPQAVVCDHDAEGRATFTNTIGLKTVAADKRVLEGIQAVTRRLRSAPDGKPRLFIFRDVLVERDQSLVDAAKPSTTAEEIPGYVWNDKRLKEEPVKENDHGCDAMRYLVMHREGRRRTGVMDLTTGLGG